MKNNYEEILIKRFNKKIENYGYDIKSLGWDIKKNQNKRFNNIFKIINLKDCKTILDVGCGFGDLFKFIIKKKIKLKYSGIDINNNFIKICKKNFPSKNCKFYNKSIFNHNQSFDLTTSFGLLNYKKCTRSYIKKFVKKCFNKSNKSALIDFISDDQQINRDKFIIYHKPEIILKEIRKVTNNYALLSDYENIPQKEFTIILYK